MVIETASKTYLVIGYLEHDKTKDLYLCENAGNQKQYRMIRIKDQRLMVKSMEFLYQQVINSSFSDLKECFVYQEHLHLVFSCQQGERLEELLGRAYCSLRERMEIGKKILEKMILQSMPYYFLSQCLRVGNIHLTRSLDVSFAYTIDDLAAYDTYSMETVENRVKEVVRLLFREELDREVVSPMKEYIHGLADCQFQDYLGILKGYLQAVEDITALSNDNLTTPKTWVFRLWDRIKRLFQPLRWMAAVSLLLAMLFYTIWNIDQTIQPAPSAPVMSQIGTLKIR